MKNLGVFSAMGFECIGLVFACVYIGRWLDEKYGWSGLGAGLGALIGFVGWFVHFMILLRELAKKNQSGHTDAQ